MFLIDFLIVRAEQPSFRESLIFTLWFLCCEAGRHCGLVLQAVTDLVGFMMEQAMRLMQTLPCNPL